MAMIRWSNDLYNPFSEFDQLQDQVNKLFNGARGFESRGLFDRTVSPAVDVTEDKDGFTVYCDLPGISNEELDINVAKDILTIKGEKKESHKKDKEAKTYRKETWEGKFQRTLALPASVDTDKTDATLKNGILTIRLPKREEVKPKQITVKAK
jgi:HSP20 family protein